MPNAMLRMSWKTFRSGSDDRVEIPSNHSELNNDRSRRNAFIFLVDVFPPARAGSGRRSLHHPGAEARSLPGAHCLGGLPVQPGSQCNLWIPQCCVRPCDLVGGRRSRGLPGTLGAAACSGLRSAHDCRPRRALLHLSYSCAPPFGRAILVTQDPWSDRRRSCSI